MKPLKESAVTQAFLDKIKSLQFSTGAKGPSCLSCGNPMSAHKLVGAIPVMIRIRRQPRARDEEASFSA